MNNISHIISGDDEEHNSIVFKFEPKKFPIKMTSEGSDFVKSQDGDSGGDFKISELVAEQTGIAERQKAKLEERVEEKTLLKLKDIEEKAYKEAFDLGLIEGTEKAFKENEAMFAEKLAEIDKVLARMQDLTSEVYAEKEAQIVKMIHTIASKIAMFEIKSNPEALVETIENLFMELKSDQRVVLKLSDDDAMFVGTLRERTGNTPDFLKQVKIEVDEGVESGGCILESNFGAIDATIEQRIQRVWAAMEEKLPRINELRNEMEPEVDAEASEPSESEEGKVVQMSEVPFTEEDQKTETVAEVEQELADAEADTESEDDEDDKKKAENE